MKDDSYIRAINWLWENRDKPFIFGYSVLTEDNRKSDPSTINPPLTPVEAANLFQFLERKELLFKQESGHYIINKIEAYKWKLLISDLKRWDWTRYWLWGSIKKGVALLTITIIGGAVGAMATKWTEDQLSKTKEIVSDQSHRNSTDSAPNNGGQNQTKN